MAENRREQIVNDLLPRLRELGFGVTAIRTAYMIADMGLQKLEDLRPHHRKAVLSWPSVGRRTWDHLAKVLKFGEEPGDLGPATVQAAERMIALGWTLSPPPGWRGWTPPAKSEHEP